MIVDILIKTMVERQDELRNSNLNNLLSEIAEQLGNSDLTDKIAIKF